MYEEFFGFRESPFRVTPDPRFLYHNPCYDEAIAALTYGIEQRKGFISLVGEVGTGKTTLLRHLLDTVAPNVRTVLLIYPTISFEEILEQILTELGIPVEGARKGTMLQRLHEFLLELTAGGGNVALLFDESQALDGKVLEELRLMSNLETGREKIVQLVLAGQPELEDKLRQPEHRQLRQRIALHVRLRPLARDEVATYIRTRLQHAGSADAELFAPDATDRIAEVTRGIPRIVNVLCDACCTTAFVTESRRITRAVVDEAWADYDAVTPTLDALGPDPVFTDSADAADTGAAAASTPAPPPAAPAIVATPAPEPAAAPSPPPVSPAPTPAASAPAAERETSPPPPPAATTPPPEPAPDAPDEELQLIQDAFAEIPTRRRPTIPMFAGAGIVAAIIGGWAAIRLLSPSLSPIGLDEVAAPPATIAPAAAPAPIVPPTPPTADAAPKAPYTPPSPLDAYDVVDAFQRAYETRDLDSLDRLFSDDASKGELRGREAVMADYQRFFEDAHDITYRQPSATAEPRQDHVLVRAPFTINYRDPADQPIEVRGIATWEGVQQGERVLIRRLDFELDPVALQ
jgi:general secretion pathway protein A